MASFHPTRQTAMSPDIELGGVIVAVNSCILCYGNQVCHECGGAGRKADGRSCFICGSTGRCESCREHCQALARFAVELNAGSFKEAEAGLQSQLIRAGKEEQNTRSTLGIGGAGLGAIVGTLLMPGLGTIVGLSAGKMLGDKVDPTQDWRHSDLLYCLGIVYAAQGRKAEADQAWIKSLAINPGHVAARAVLRMNP